MRFRFDERVCSSVEFDAVTPFTVRENGPELIHPLPARAGLARIHLDDLWAAGGSHEQERYVYRSSSDANHVRVWGVVRSLIESGTSGPGSPEGISGSCE
jgi:hypothetical protein